MNRRHFVAGCGASLLSLVAAHADVPRSLPLTAAEVLGRLARAYASCASYRDTGLVRSVFMVNGTEVVRERPFETAFVRPDRFRFEFREKIGAGQPNTRYLIARRGKVIQTWWDLRPGVGTAASFSEALGAAAGISGMASLTVPALLLPIEVGPGLKALKQLKRLDDAELDGVACYRIDGVYSTTPLSLWIDKGSDLLRRIDESVMIGATLVETTTTYAPVAGGEVTAGLLAFDPPK